MSTPAQAPADVVEVAKSLAERVVELEQLVEQREAELHATEVDRLRLLEIERDRDRLLGRLLDPGIPVPIGDLRRLVDLATTGALAESVLEPTILPDGALRNAILEDRAGLVLAYRSALGIDEVRS